MRLNPAHMARARVVEANDLFLSQPEGTYRLSENVGRGYSTTGWSWGADFFDADHDGDDDLYVLNGMNEFRVYGQENPYYADAEGTAMQGSFPPAAAQANVFFENTGGKLVNASEGSGLDRVSNGRSFVAVDYDHDGDLDVITLDYHGPAIVYQNLLDAPGSQWLQVTLEGDVQAGSARDAVGAVVTAKVGDRLLWRQVTGSRGYQSVSPRALHFGLGTTETVELSVRWPSGAHRVYPSVRAGQRVVLREAQAVQ